MNFFKNKNDLLFHIPEKELRSALKNLLGFKPHYLPFYILALTHRSKNEQTAGNNERLEYLGDAFIGAVVGKYLFKKYPNEDEGYLTEMRSKIVSRHSLNEIAHRMGLQKILFYNQSDRLLRRSHIFGNALEALVGAVYLDVGFKKTEQFILERVLDPNINMDELEHTEYNFKNKLYSWAQHHEKQLDFVTLSESNEAGRKVFTIGVLTDNKEIARATGYSKKEAGQIAAKNALKNLAIPEEDNRSSADF